MKRITFQPIGIIHTPYKEAKSTPIQPKRSDGTGGVIEIYPEFTDGLTDLDGFSHIILLYYFHRCRGFSLSVVPYLDTVHRGLFSTRAPRRPNRIGLSVVRLVKREGSQLHIVDVDMIDSTPLLDIKPFVPNFDDISDCKIGWLSEVIQNADTTSADGRFHG